MSVPWSVWEFPIAGLSFPRNFRVTEKTTKNWDHLGFFWLGWPYTTVGAKPLEPRERGDPESCERKGPWLFGMVGWSTLCCRGKNPIPWKLESLLNSEDDSWKVIRLLFVAPVDVVWNLGWEKKRAGKIGKNGCFWVFFAEKMPSCDIFLNMGVSWNGGTQQPWVFLLKWSFWSVLGVPPF